VRIWENLVFPFSRNDECVDPSIQTDMAWVCLHAGLDISVRPSARL
jgi:hypothetical protein